MAPAFGMPKVSSPGIPADPFNMGLGGGLEYASRGEGSFTQYGKGWMPHDLAGLVFSGDDVLYEEGPRQIETFIEDAGEYTATAYVRSLLEKKVPGGGSPDYFMMTLPGGERRKFDLSGKLVKIYNPFGKESTVTWSGDEVDTVAVSDGTADAEFDYTWSSGRLASIAYSLDSTDVRRVSYEYTGSGELQKVIQEEPNGSGGWTAIETIYFGYHSGGAGLLKFVLGHEAYDRWQSSGGSSGTLSEYADYEYSYNGTGTVSQVKAKGGSYVTNYAYSWGSSSITNINHWANKITETRSDGTVITYYTNFAGELILKKVAKGGNTWYPIYQQFESVTGRVTLQAQNSAIASVNEASPTLVTLQTGSGLIRTIEYDSSAGLKSGWYVQEGSSGSTKAKLGAISYTSHTYDGVSIYKTHQETAYRAPSPTGANGVTTTHAYTWHVNGGVETNQVKKHTVTLPAVSFAQNGTGMTATTESHFDEWGFKDLEVDERGIVTKYAYDRARGGMTEMILNYEAMPPSPEPSDMNLTTNFQLDNLGRTTLRLGPVHTIDVGGSPAEIRSGVWTQYLDADDEVITIQGYRKIISPSTHTDHTINPVQITKTYENDPNVTGGGMRSSIAAQYSGAGIPSEMHTYARSSWKRWTSQHYSKGGEQTHSRIYHKIPTSGAGTPADTYYAQTDFGYDSVGRKNQVTSPEGTITTTVFNAMGWTEKVEVGTNSTNQVEVAKYTYANDAGLDAHPSKLSQAVDGTPSNNRDTTYTYDYRNRMTASVVSDEVDSVTRPYITIQGYDNLSRVTLTATYHTSYSSGSPNNNLITRSTSAYDNRGRVYETKQYGDTGSEATAQLSQTWYDASGNVVRQEGAGSETFVVTNYNSQNRPTTTFIGYVPGSSSSSSSSSSSTFDPSDVSGSVIVEQTEQSYDQGGNTIATVNRARFDDAVGLGTLGTPSVAPKARVSYSGMYPDAIGRPQAGVNVGTYGGSAWPRPTTIPTRSDTVLVNSFEYDSSGKRVATIDPAGRVDKTSYDAAGRSVETIENYKAASLSSSSSSSSGVSCIGENRTTNYDYNLDGRLTTLTSQNDATGDQVTTWIYGVDDDTKGSLINSNALLWKKIRPVGEGGGDATSIYKYNRQGQALEFQDAADTKHNYLYDGLGRMISDVASDLPATLDDSILKITRSYDNHLRLQKVGSYPTSASTTPLNEVEYEYNSFGQLTADKQDHDGVASRQVGYTYASGSANTVRPTGVTYPSGVSTTIKYDADAANKLSRPDKLALDGTNEVSYRYLGLGQIIGVDYLAPGLEMTYEDGGTGSAGDKYSGLDTFGRVVESLWLKGGVVKENVQYGYDQASNRKWRRNKLAHDTLSNGEEDKHDNFYWYDGLYQVTQRQLGDLTGTAPNYTGITNRQQKEVWCFDETGNWNKYSNEDQSNLVQSREHNEANEISSVTNPSGVIQPVYDKVGNQTVDIAPLNPGDWDTQFNLTWDAWNRLIEVENNGTSTVVQTNAYDGLHRRTTSSDGTDTTHYYYKQEWRAVEEYKNSETAPERRYLWGMRSRWDLVKRERDDSGSLDEERYVIYDAMDPVATSDAAGTVTQRFEYSPFGETTFLNDDFTEDATPEDWNFLFHGEFRDTDTGYYNYGFRYYHPQLGRWPSRDPIEEDGGVNLYAMVGNNPVSSWDLLGLTECDRGDINYVRFCIIVNNGGLKKTKYCTDQIEDAMKKLLKGKAKDGFADKAKDLSAGSNMGELLKSVENLAGALKKGGKTIDQVGGIAAVRGAFSLKMTVDFQCCDCYLSEHGENWHWGKERRAESALGGKDDGLTYSFSNESIKRIPQDYKWAIIDLAEQIAGKCSKDPFVKNPNVE
jgi:RHS repeat-associated protein